MSDDPRYQLTGNTRQDVKRIARELLWSGIQPTGARIREVIGQKPSQTTVQAALREFYTEHGEYLRNERKLPTDVLRACEVIAAYVANPDSEQDPPG